MANADELFSQLQGYAQGASDVPAQIESTIKKAYQPQIQSLIEEGQVKRAKAYPAMFQELSQIGTGAADLSPEAALASALGGAERAMSGYRTNLGLRDYYGTQINDLVGKGLQGYQMGYGTLKDMYDMAEDRRRFDAQMAARGGSGGGGGGGDLASILAGLLGQQQGGNFGFKAPSYNFGSSTAGRGMSSIANNAISGIGNISSNALNFVKNKHGF